MSLALETRKGGGEDPPPFLSSYYEQVLVEASHFMWAFSQAALFFGASAANVGATKATARPNATINETRFFMEAISQGKRYHCLVASLGYA